MNQEPPPDKGRIFTERLLRWFKNHGRRFPWRETDDPYRIFVAEFMLQRTGAPQVVPVYQQFLESFPTLSSAAAASERELRDMLFPLGRVERYLTLAAAFRAIMGDFSGQIPSELHELRSIPGIGQYTARAILCFVYNQRVGLLDPNIYRLASRVLSLTTEKRRPRADRTLWESLDALLPHEQFRELNLAMLDYGTLVCRARNPRCDECILWRICTNPKRDDPDAGFTFIDLFCGAGGLAEGFRQAGFRSVFAVELDRHAAETYRTNFGDHVFEGDIAALSNIPVDADVVIGGPPCQGFSALGKMFPTANHTVLNGLWKEFVRVVELVSPKALVIENVPSFLRSPQYRALRERVEQLGYQLAAGVLNAAHFGVPQRRKRGFIIGLKGARPHLPEPSGQRSTVRDAIGDLPLEPDGLDWHIGRNPTARSIERYRCIPPGGNRFDLIEKRPDITPRCWLEKPTGSTDVFGRLEWDKPALTIRTEFFKPEKGRYLHPEADRALTHREAARLQTFPDDFVFVGGKAAVAEQIGNAVPPQLAKAVAECLLEVLVGPESAQG